MAYSVVISWNVLTPFLVQVHFGYSAHAYAWMSLLVACFYYLAAHFNRSLVMKFHVGNIFIFGELLIGLAGLTMILGGDQLLFLLIPMVIATFGQALLFSNTIAGAMHNYSHISGKVSAIYSSLQMMLVSVISAGMAFLPDQTFVMGIILIILSCLCFICLISTNTRDNH